MKDKRILTLFITILIDLIGFGIVIPILPNLTKTIAIKSGFIFGPDMAVGIVVFCFAIMQFIFAPLWGSVSDRVGRRPIILGSILITAVGYFIFGFGQSLWILFIARIISGIGSANISAAQAYIADITLPHDRAKRMGLIGAAFGIGFVLGPPLGGWLFHLGQNSLHIGQSLLENGNIHYPEGGLRLIGYVAATICLINFAMAYFLLPESLTEKNTDRRKFLKSFEGLTTIWKVEVVGELFVINFIYIAAFMMMQINSSVLWKEKYHLNEEHIGYIFGFIGLCSAIIQGGLIGYFQRVIGVKKMLLYGCPLVAVGLTIMPLPSQAWFYPVQIISILLLTVGNGFLMPSINALVSINTSREDQGKTLGLLQSLGSLARAVGPLLSTFLYAFYNGLPYFVAGLLMLGAFYLASKLVVQIKDEDKPVPEIAIIESQEL